MTYTKSNTDLDQNIVPHEDIVVKARKMEAPGQLQVAKDIARLKAMGESKAAKIADRLILYDNSTNAGHQLIATVEGDRAIIHVRELPRWLDQAILTPLSIE